MTETSNNPESVRLTRREREVMELLCQGMTSADISRALKKSPRTVDMQRLSSTKKLGAKNSVEAAVLFDRMNRTIWDGEDLEDIIVESVQDSESPEEAAENVMAKFHELGLIVVAEQ